MPHDLWEEKANKFFNSINDPKRPEYWSHQKLEYDIEMNRQINNLIKDMTWEQVLDFAFDRCLHYLKANPYKSSYAIDNYCLYGSSGNGRPDQYEFNFCEFEDIVIYKLFEQYGIKSYYKENLGYGHKAEAVINDGANICIDNKKRVFWINYTPSVKNDPGFHDELKTIGKQIQKDILNYRKKSKYCTKPIDELLNEIEL